jgi:hypothetical protein
VVAQARAAGLLVLGYVSTDYGARPLGEVLAEMDRYAQWYGVRSFFLDEGTHEPERVGHYRVMADRAHALGGVVLINFGEAPDEAYMAFTDIAGIYENASAPYLAGYAPPPWVANYDPGRFMHLIHATPGESLEAVLALTQASGVGNVWITDTLSPTDSPYKDIPSYWTELNATLEAGCGR